MRRKLVAGFRTLLDEAVNTSFDAGFHSGDDDEDSGSSARKARRARNKLERLALQLLIMADYVTSDERKGMPATSSVHGLRDAVDGIAEHGKMKGRKFVRNIR